jgi:hypothetical protein
MLSLLCKYVRLFATFAGSLGKLEKGQFTVGLKAFVYLTQAEFTTWPVEIQQLT